MPNITNQKMSKSKIYTFAVVAVMLLVGLIGYVFVAQKSTDKQSNQVTLQNIKKNDAYSSIRSDEILRTGSEADLVWDESDPYYGFKKDPVVALVHIDSIDGGRTYSPISAQYVYPQTVGKMTVLNVYKGNLKSDEQLNYSRVGGIVTFDEYWNSLNKAQKDKILYLNKGKKPTEKKYVQAKFVEDIDIEVDKNYVVFLLPQTSKDGSRLEYFVDGFQHGLREVKGSGADMQVRNNSAKKWESLGSVVKLN